MFENMRFDGLTPGAGSFFARQLEHIMAEVLQEKVPPRSAFQLFPMDFSVPIGAKTYTQEMWTGMGEAKIIADWATDIPMVSVGAEQETFNVKYLADGYQYSLEEIEAASYARVPLNARKASTARLAMEQLHNRIFWYGDETAKLHGVLNYPYIPKFALADGIDSGTTADNIANMLFDFMYSPYTLTKTTARPTILVLPPTQYLYLATTPRNGTSDTTILEYMNAKSSRANKSFEILDAHELQADGVNLTQDHVLAYSRDPRVFACTIPGGRAFEQLPPQQQALHYKVPCIGLNGGVRVHYPLEMAVGILPA